MLIGVLGFTAACNAQQENAEPLLDLRINAIEGRHLTPVNPLDADGSFGDRVTTSVNSRGVVVTSFDDDFSSYPTSTDPIFDRFQVNIGSQTNPSGDPWGTSQFWNVPSLFVDGQVEAGNPGVSDPLPRWQGVRLTESDGIAVLRADINVPGGDGVVDSADLGTLIAHFGTSNPISDINVPGGDGIVDTADLGVLINDFGQTPGPYCSYMVTKVNPGDPEGFPLDPTTLANAPAVGQLVAVLQSDGYNNDGNADGCPDCEFFSILVDGAVGDELVYGDWTLVESDLVDLGAVDFSAEVDSVSCDGWGDEIVLADLRSEASFSFPGFLPMAELQSPVFTVDPAAPLIVNCDVFMSSYETFTWMDSVSNQQGMVASRLFLGGYFPTLNPNWLKYSSRSDGLIDHFIFFGNSGLTQAFGSIADPALPVLAGVPNVGKQILLNEWFTISVRLSPTEYSVWVRDSETMALTDPMPGDDGSGTTMDGSDDIEDGFAKIFPFGPFGVTAGDNIGPVPDIPQIPQPLLGASTVDAIAWLSGADPPLGPPPFPEYQRRPVFFDNVHIEGVLLPPEE